jgi:hypothetical protein
VDKLTHDLAEALEKTLSWLTSYQGGGAINCYDNARKTLDQYRAQLEQSERDKQNLYP